MPHGHAEYVAAFKGLLAAVTGNPVDTAYAEALRNVSDIIGGLETHRE